MLKKLLKNYNLILASGSPRRQNFLKQLELDFEIRLKPVDEVYPDEFKHSEITDYLSQLKAKPFLGELNSNDILVTSDTIVWLDEQALGKPKNEAEAKKMLQVMSGKSHDVITSICFTTPNFQETVNSITIVYFKNLNNSEIDYYVNQFKPLDKAGAYGIQEWIGMIGITKIEGSYENVVGLPTQLFYETLSGLLKHSL